MAALATETGFVDHCLPFPSGDLLVGIRSSTCLFARITMNWRWQAAGQPRDHREHHRCHRPPAPACACTPNLTPGRYPIGVTVSDPNRANLPIIRHDWHGDWSYTLHPATPESSASYQTDAEPQRPDSGWLHNPALTGFEDPAWGQLIEQLGVARHALKKAALHRRRGRARPGLPAPDARRSSPWKTAPPITLLYQGFAPPQRTLAQLFGVNQQTIQRVIKQTRALLTTIGYTPESTGLRLTIAAKNATRAANAAAVIRQRKPQVK